jgi:hypothetical protein
MQRKESVERVNREMREEKNEPPQPKPSAIMSNERFGG